MFEDRHYLPVNYVIKIDIMIVVTQKQSSSCFSEQLIFYDSSYVICAIKILLVNLCMNGVFTLVLYILVLDLFSFDRDITYDFKRRTAQQPKNVMQRVPGSHQTRMYKHRKCNVSENI